MKLRLITGTRNEEYVHTALPSFMIADIDNGQINLDTTDKDAKGPQYIYGLISKEITSEAFVDIGYSSSESADLRHNLIMYGVID